MKSTSEITRDIPEVNNAIDRACSLVLVRNAMIAPSKGMAIMSEINPAI
jgi:hypothetical protein